MYGLAKGISSLRELEELARLDLGCMWVCAGIQPDHSNIGRFILRHQEEFEGEFFERVTRLALKATRSGTTDVAGDGTVIQAAASRYRTLKREALDRKLGEAKKEVDKDPDDDDKKGTLEKYEAADKALQQREKARAAQHKSTDTLRVSTTEPEAPIQPLKNKSFAPSYKPSVVANPKRVIVGMAVSPTSEVEPLTAMLEQAEKIGESSIEKLKLDAGYFQETVIQIALDRDINLLCPEDSASGRKPHAYAKSQFQYDEDIDAYTCPAGQTLTPSQRANAESYTRYATKACDGCSHRAHCSPKSKAGRTVKRYDVDEAKDALKQVLEHPEAQRDYRQRKAMVEPVFSVLAGKMGLRRFRRKGLRRVRGEFALFACAYNLTRVLAAQAANWRSRFFLAVWRITSPLTAERQLGLNPSPI
jgi:hypothetical protein